MVKELCPKCNKELMKGICASCGYDKSKMPFSLPVSSSGGGYAFVSDVQRKAFFAWLRATGRYDPNYHSRKLSGGSVSNVPTNVVSPKNSKDEEEQTEDDSTKNN